MGASTRSQFSGILYYVDALVSPSLFHSMRKCSKTYLMGRAWKLGVHFFFNRYECFHGILWYISSHVKWMGVPTNLRQIFRNIHPIGRAWNIGTCIFPKVWMSVFDHILTLYFACDDKLHHIRNAWIFPWISHRMRKRSKARIIGNI